MRRARHAVRALLLAAAVAGALAAAGCGSEASSDPGVLGGSERKAAQKALDSLQGSNVALQLVTLTQWVQSVPTACRIRRASGNPDAFHVYVFWKPWLAAAPYIWLDMNVPADPRKGTYRLGTSAPVLPGGRLSKDGRAVVPGSVDTTLLSRYGPNQVKKGRELMLSNGGDVWKVPGADCQLLRNGSLRLLPAS